MDPRGGGIQWGTPASMSGEREIKGQYLRTSPTSIWMHAKFAYSAVPNNTTSYIQGVIKTAHSTAKTAAHEFLIRSKPI